MPEIYPIPEPYVWDRSFAVFYPDMDEEHKPLFTCVADLATNNGDADLLASCLKAYEDHFVHEQRLFKASNTYSDKDKYQHINKHNAFLATMRGLQVPVAAEWVAFAKNWLTQHIKNTDFKYKYKLATQHKTPEPYIWNNEFEVFYKRLDDEHKGLFKIMFAVENNPED